MSSSRHDDPQGRPSRSRRSDSEHGFDRDADYLMPEADEIIRRAMEIIDSSPSMPMSSSVRVNKEEILEMLDDALRRLPEEVRQAKWLLKDREAFLADREREGEAIIARAAANAARLVERREVVKTAQARAEEILDDASRNARRRQREADDYCDHQLARYENALVKLHKQVSKMRDRLAAPSIEESELGGSARESEPRSTGTGGPRTGQTRAVQRRAGQSRAAQDASGAPPSERSGASSGRPRRPTSEESAAPSRQSRPDPSRADRPVVFDQDT